MSHTIGISAGIVGIVLFGGLTAGHAAEPTALDAWKAAAQAEIGRNMFDPSPLLSRWDRQPWSEHNEVRLVIAPDGTVVGARLVRQSGDRLCDKASRRFAKAIDKLPALPAAYAAGETTVRVHLIYARSQGGYDRALREIAQETHAARVKGVDVAAAPVIELAAGGY